MSAHTYQGGRADAWQHAADMLDDMLAKGNDPELMLVVFRAIAQDAREYADRVNPAADVTVTW